MNIKPRRRSIDGTTLPGQLARSVTIRMSSLPAFTPLAVWILSSCSVQTESGAPVSLPGARADDESVLDGSGSNDAGVDPDAPPSVVRGAIILHDDGKFAQYPRPIKSPMQPNQSVMLYGSTEYYLLIRGPARAGHESPSRITFPMSSGNHCNPCNMNNPGDLTKPCNPCNGYNIVACWHPSPSTQGYQGDIDFWREHVDYEMWGCKASILPGDPGGSDAPGAGTLHVGTDNT